MNLPINLLANHDIRCIVVPKEKMTNPSSDYTKIVYGSQEFEIITQTSISRPEPIPSTLKLISIGKDVSDSKIWDKYKDSSKIYFFIVKKI